jgi:uncharacterized protein YndB with AHSA1/START domain
MTDRIGNAARVTALVAVEPRVAFEVFTREIDQWWRRGPRFRFDGRKEGKLRFEGEAGGRLVESFDDGSAPFEVGRVLVWEPGARLVFEWRTQKFRPGEVTEVDVRFEPSASGTRVTLEHRGWDALAAEHPVRHGLTGRAFSTMIGLWWGDLLTSLRAYVQASRP